MPITPNNTKLYDYAQLIWRVRGEFSLAPLNGPDDNFDLEFAAGMGTVPNMVIFHFVTYMD